MIALISKAKREVRYIFDKVSSRCSILKLTNAREVNETITCFKYIDTGYKPNRIRPPSLHHNHINSSQSSCFVIFFLPFEFDQKFLTPPLSTVAK
jgi:hypothetical protein